MSLKYFNPCRANNCGTRSHQRYFIVPELTNTDKIMNDTFWIGLYPGLTEEMLAYVSGQIESFFGVNF